MIHECRVSESDLLSDGFVEMTESEIDTEFDDIVVMPKFRGFAEGSCRYARQRSVNMYSVTSFSCLSVKFMAGISEPGLMALGF